MIRKLFRRLVEAFSRQIERPGRTWRRPWDNPCAGDNLNMLAAIIDRGIDCWAAREEGECVTCGHDWIPGEIIGTVQHAYRVRPDGGIEYAPAARLACCVCVEWQRQNGDPSIVWAREAGVAIGAHR